MKAAIFHGAGQPLALETVDDPTPGPNDLIVKVHRCGICGTDLHMTSGHGWDFAAGSVLGHEYAGEIVELGSAVEGYRKGDIVSAMPVLGCGRCEACAVGNWALCTSLTPVMGGFGEYDRVPAAVAIKLPATFSLADGALVEPLAVGLHGVRSAAIRPGDRVLVLGGGAVALTTIFWAKRLGASRVVALSRSPRRGPLALEMGADAYVTAGEDEIGQVTEALGGPPDIVFECVGAPGLLAQAIQHVRLYGQVLSLGFCTAPDTFIPALAGVKAVRLGFPVGYALRDFQYAADVMLAGKADPKRMITSVIGLDELPATFEMLRGPNAETKVHVSMAGR